MLGVGCQVQSMWGARDGIQDFTHTRRAADIQPGFEILPALTEMAREIRTGAQCAGARRKGTVDGVTVLRKSVLA